MTGDVGVLDADGYLTITDRKKDIIIRGGENISAAEVEELLAPHAGRRRGRGGRPRPTTASARTAARSSGCSRRTTRRRSRDGARAASTRPGLAKQKWPEHMREVDGVPADAERQGAEVRAAPATPRRELSGCGVASTTRSLRSSRARGKCSARPRRAQRVPYCGLVGDRRARSRGRARHRLAEDGRRPAGAGRRARSRGSGAIALRETHGLPGDLLLGLLVLAGAGIVADVLGRPVLVGAVLAVPGSARDRRGGAGEAVVVAVARRRHDRRRGRVRGIVRRPSPRAVDSRRRSSRSAAAGVYFTVPDTEHALVLIGAALPLALSSWPVPLARLGSGGAYAATGLLAWTAATDGVARAGVDRRRDGLAGTSRGGARGARDRPDRGAAGCTTEPDRPPAEHLGRGAVDRRCAMLHRPRHVACRGYRATGWLPRS